MIKAKIENGKETLYLDLPCDQETLNAKFGGGSDEIKVTFSGESKFEKRLISLIRPGNRLSTINCICGFYENLPSADKTDIQDAVMSGEVFSFLDFGKLVIDRRQQDVTEYYYKDLIVEYLRKYGKASKQDIRDLLWDKLPNVLDDNKKNSKISTLLTALRKKEIITTDTSNQQTSRWILVESEKNSNKE